MDANKIKKLVKIGACVVSGIIAFATALGDQKNADELEELKKKVSKLENEKS